MQTPRKGKNNSAEGAEDNSQGQARSAPPLEAVCKEFNAPREGRDDDLPNPSDQFLSPLRGSVGFASQIPQLKLRAIFGRAYGAAN